MPRFFSKNINGEKCVITGDDAKHISKVLRMRTGDEVTVCDTEGHDYLCKIEDISKTEVVLKVCSVLESVSESDVKISVFQALPKASKMETIIQKCTELGAYEFFPCALSRCVVKFENKSDASKKAERWQAISEAAAKQSMRGIIPKVHSPVSFLEAIEKLKTFDLCFVCYENETETTLKSLLSSKSDVKNVAFLIGPEGGIADEEAKLLSEHNIKTVSLGKRILRTETAPVAVLAMLNYEFDK